VIDVAVEVSEAGVHLGSEIRDPGVQVVVQVGNSRVQMRVLVDRDSAEHGDDAPDPVATQ